MCARRLVPCLLAAALGCARTAPPPPPDAAPPEAAAATAVSAPPTASASAEPSTSASASAAPASASPSAAASPPVPAELGSVDDIVTGAIDRGEVPGAVIAVVRGGAVVFEKAYGLRSKEPDERPMTADTVFDLASLTKAVVTAPSIMLLAEQGKLRLADPVARHLPSFGKRGKDVITVEQLLLHTSGLLADNALADYQGGRDKAFARIDALEPTRDPGTAFVYSDVGFIVLGELVEKVSGEALDAFARKRIFEPLGMRDTAYNPPPALAARAAPTEPRDGRLLQGEVHDPRAHLLGGVAGHAGLFSTAADLAIFARMLLRKGRDGETRILAPPTLLRMTAPHELPDGARRALGWDLQAGRYGHTGFTGTSLWIDPASDTAAIILTSRLHPDGKGDPRRLRREVAAAVARGRLTRPADTAAAPPRGSVEVSTGIDVLERDGFAALKGRRVGLVTNPSGVDRKGRSTIDVLRAAEGVTLVALFSPEHGIRGGVDRAVADSRDEKSGLPVYSLYGERTRPNEAELAGIDTLVFDLQDAGARFYTYITTLGFLLETAAAHHLRVVVLDRPNPIGGAAVEGPVLEAGRTSFIGYHPLPVRHGMTVGELAGLFNTERKIGADLQVIRMKGWRRELTFDRTDLRWVNPSPNLRSVDEALLYPGVALLEATNLSVGRGTDRPFEQVGAPFVDGARLAAALGEARLAGVAFAATTFTPASSTFAGQRCGGVTVRITDRARFEPVRAGLAVAQALGRLYPSDWQSKNVLLLLGHQPTYAALVRGDPLDALAAGWRPGLDAFMEVRKKALLYLE
jgi:uncharacterized protein YbbC (DUF1343 family)